MIATGKTRINIRINKGRWNFLIATTSLEQLTQVALNHSPYSSSCRSDCRLCSDSLGTGVPQELQNRLVPGSSLPHETQNLFWVDNETSDQLVIRLRIPPIQSQCQLEWLAWLRSIEIGGQIKNRREEEGLPQEVHQWSVCRSKWKEYRWDWSCYETLVK